MDLFANLMEKGNFSKNHYFKIILKIDLSKNIFKNRPLAGHVNATPVLGAVVALAVAGNIFCFGQSWQSRVNQCIFSIAFSRPSLATPVKQDVIYFLYSGLWLGFAIPVNPQLIFFSSTHINIQCMELFMHETNEESNVGLQFKTERGIYEARSNIQFMKQFMQEMNEETIYAWNPAILLFLSFGLHRDCQPRPNWSSTAIQKC